MTTTELDPRSPASRDDARRGLEGSQHTGVLDRARCWMRDLRASDPRLVDLVVLYVVIKLTLLGVGTLGSGLLPFNWPLYNANLLMDVQGLPDLFRQFNTWDTQHYLFLAQQGYGVNPMSNAFYPLYPYLIWLFTPFFFDKGLIAAYVIANVFSLLVPVYLYKLCRLYWTSEQAFRAAVLLLAFPTAFFLSVAYTEALYLSVCLMAFYYILKNDTLKACLFCFLFPLTRLQALLFMAPLGVLFLQDVFAARGDLRARVAGALRAYLPPVAATLAGILVYLALCQWKLGDWRAGIGAQQFYVAGNSIANLLHPLQWFIENFVAINLSLHGYTNSIIDRAAFVLCLPLLIGVYRTQSKALFTYAAVTMLVPALSGHFMSTTRFLLVVFPLFITLALRVKRFEYVAIPMFALQVLLYLMHTGGYWVA